MKFVAFMLYVIPQTLDHVCEPCKKIDNFHLMNEIFENIDHMHKNVIN
jgi:hypothetical protein